MFADEKEKQFLFWSCEWTSDASFSQQPTHFENPGLFCDYFTNGNPGLLLLPVRREVLSLQPYVVLYHNFITDTEAEDIQRLAQPGVSVHFPHSLVGKEKTKHESPICQLFRN